MIQNKNDLKEYLKDEKKLYIKNGFFNVIGQYISGSYEPKLYRYILHMRKAEYYINTKNGIQRKIGYCYHKRKKMKLGLKLGIHIGNNAFEKGLKIYHPFGIIVNGNSRIGKNCTISGNLCIGNNGSDNSKCPVIGNNVTIGYGTTIIGDVKISDSIIIGANSLVNKSFENEYSVIAGNPAKLIRNIKQGDNKN